MEQQSTTALQLTCRHESGPGHISPLGLYILFSKDQQIFFTPSVTVQYCTDVASPRKGLWAPLQWVLP